MAVLGRAGKLPTLELRKARGLDRDSRLIRRNDLESVAMIADPHSGDSGLAVARSLNGWVLRPPREPKDPSADAASRGRMARPSPVLLGEQFGSKRSVPLGGNAKSGEHLIRPSETLAADQLGNCTEALAPFPSGTMRGADRVASATRRAYRSVGMPAPMVTIRAFPAASARAGSKPPKKGAMPVISCWTPPAAPARRRRCPAITQAGSRRTRVVGIRRIRRRSM
jgi:hypothetical protein